jgi:L-seryl-tRNA(Ser) seleniumtransferase
MREGLYRDLPSTDLVLRSPAIEDLLKGFDRGAVLGLVREVLQRFRDDIGLGGEAPTLDHVVAQVTTRAEGDWRSAPRPVINATGVLLHTNLGRAPLSQEALEAVRVAGSYSDLELDLGTGQRGSRQTHAAAMLRTLTGADAALVTVNAASGVLLALSALARRKEIIVSRGQAVEIGGGFRIPDVLRESGARLIEVGTTNRTRIADYEEAISEKTAGILHVHSSNFRVVGFTERVELRSLSLLARSKGILLIDDNGSGCLLDTAQFGLEHEPTPVESLQAGADVVVFSGDKLLGGPQAGIILGAKDPLRKIALHPLSRAVRPDKMTIAALTATLLSYVRGDAVTTLPLWRMIALAAGAAEARAQWLVSELTREGIEAHVVVGESTLGGGSLPTEVLPTVLVRLPRRLTAKGLRSAEPPVIGKASRGQVLLDIRTLLEGQEFILRDCIVRAARRAGEANAAVGAAAR